MSEFKLATPDNFIDVKGNLVDPYRSFIAISKYARWLDDKQRRETWVETVNRYVDYMVSRQEKRGVKVAKSLKEEIRHAITYHHIMPSMRALMTAGPALDKNDIAGYNCSFLAIDSVRAFDETMMVLMHGTGVGFSVEDKYVRKLPEVSENFEKTDTVIRVEDSKEGWAKAFRELLALAWAGQIPDWDVSEVRPKGARLKTFGGRASGPGPLVELFEFTISKIQKAAGRQLSSIEVHDIMCKIGDIVVAGGVRRSALISLSDLKDTEMAKAKSGAWWTTDPQRQLSNNSAAYYRKPTMEAFFNEWKALYDSKSGERGIVNLDSARRHAESFNRRDGGLIQGTNPCGEILLRSLQFCNLTEVVIRAEDNLETLSEKVRLASILGTWQASHTNFRHLRRKWKENCEEEALLGVSLTGEYGHEVMNGNQGLDVLGEWLDTLRELAVDVNKKESKRIGINPATAVTCVKPSGTASQLVMVSSGLHPWHAEKYARRIRGNNIDPITQLMVNFGVPSEPAVGDPNNTTVFEFPIAAPEGAVTQSQVSAIDHLKMWLTYRQHWTEHNPSVTITVREDEWLEVGAFVYKNFNDICGVSFLPDAGNHTYQQAPYQELTQEEYDDLVSRSRTIPWEHLHLYEMEDATTSSQELACTGGACEIVDISSPADEEDAPITPLPTH